MMNLSKTDRLYAALSDGAQLTAKQIASRYRVVNPHDMVYNLRREGVNIEMNTRVNRNGENVRFYVLNQRKNKSRAA
jgi:hypothetical protein